MATLEEKISDLESRLSFLEKKHDVSFSCMDAVNQEIIKIKNNISKKEDKKID